MLPKKYRLKNDNDFARVYKKGNRKRTQNLNLVYLKTGQNEPRFGFVVSKKQAAKTVDRNKIKRRLRNIVAKNIEEVDPRYDVVISAGSRSLDLSSDELETEVQLLLKKARILLR